MSRSWRSPTSRCRTTVSAPDSTSPSSSDRCPQPPSPSTARRARGGDGAAGRRRFRGMRTLLILSAVAATGLLAQPAAAASAYRLPLDGPPVVVRAFAPPPEPWLPGHRGVDLAARPGATVVSAGPGIVAFAGVVAGRPVISIDHPGGLRTTYEPVASVVPAGEAVEPGTPIGTLSAGHPGCPVAACLHWGLRSGDTYLDPLSLLGGGPVHVRLLPLKAIRPAASAAPRPAARSRAAGCTRSRPAGENPARARRRRAPRRSASR
jgi:murein DD-endopeptidase MepM/ murein hydrolase activator NlpD